MNPNEVRYQLISTLLQADGPLTLRELVDRCGMEEGEILPVLKDLVDQHLMVEGELLPDKPMPHLGRGALDEDPERFAIPLEALRV